MALFVWAMCSASQTFAQGWSFDARKIGMGSADSGDNPATSMIGEESGYQAIVLPFGLLQIQRDLDVFRPKSDKFDIVRTIEYAAAPLHYVFGRDKTSDSGRQLVVDLRNATLNRDLNAYRGFVPANQPVAEGLAAPSYGYILKVHRGAGGAFQGLYVGAGPYITMRSAVDIDPRIISLLDSETIAYLPNTRFRLTNATRGEVALAITGGYRARFVSLSGAGSEPDGAYVAVDYHYLRGTRYEQFNTSLRLDTDANGLLTVNASASPPLVVARDHASTGHGAAVDAGIGIVANRLELGFGVLGIGNHIDWTGTERTTYSLGNLLQGTSDFVESLPGRIGDVRVELPLDYRANAGYRAEQWRVRAEYGHGFQGTSFHGGAERSIGRIDLRGGALYSRARWEPSGGIGLNVTRRIAIDLAGYGTRANVERVRRLAIAFSLRIRAKEQVAGALGKQEGGRERGGPEGLPLRTATPDDSENRVVIGAVPVR